MADDSSGAFERLRTSIRRLNAVCDVAAQTVRDIETFLELTGTGVSAWVDVKKVWADGESSAHTRISLGYDRHSKGKFRIVVAHSPSWAQEPDDVLVRAWAECSQEDKLDSFEKLPDLLTELGKRIDEQTVKAEQTVLTLRSLLPPTPKKRKGAD